MPRFKPRPVLERSAAGDLWKHTLSRIPTVFGRIAYLASLRDPSSGVYRHHGLSGVFGREESTQALRSSHEEVFLEWIALPMREKRADVEAYLNSLDDPREAVIEHLLRTEIYRAQVPGTAEEMERELYLSDLITLLKTFRSAASRGGPVKPS